MPTPKPGSESKDDWMGRCIPVLMDEGNEQDQAVAICSSMWEDATKMFKRISAAQVDQFTYVLSDSSKDRAGDKVDVEGWDTKNFLKNPVALFNHNQNFPIGRWENIRVEGGKLLGRLVLAAKGTSDRVDEIRSLVEQGILKAVSVGFKPISAEPIKGGGVFFKRQELLEASLVAVPAHAGALSLAKSMEISKETLAMVFGEDADKDQNRPTGKSAAMQRNKRSGQMPTLAERIEEIQTKLAGLQTKLDEHINSMGEDADDDFNIITDELNGKIETTEKTLDTLREAEARLAASSSPVIVEPEIEKDVRKTFARPAAKIEPIDYIFRAMTAKVVSHVYKKNLVDTMKALYGEDIKTKAVMDQVIGIDDIFDSAGFIVQKAAVAPADTATSGWASQLVQTAVGDFFELLLPQSVYPGLSAQGGRFGFGRNGTVSMPTRDATPTVAGSFVGEGSPIPVRRAAFSAVTLTPKKMAVITTMTREITERSTPAIEQLLRNAIQEDTAVSIDSVLLDANAATSVRPAGLRNGITTAAGTAGGGIAAIVADVKGMLGTLTTNTNGNIRNPVWIMNPIQAIALGLTQNAGGDFPFKAEVNGNRFQGYPLIQSATVPAGVVILIDAADFFSATGDDPRFDVSDQATLHMEDTTPLAIGTAGTPNVVAAPVRSLFQTDSLALRMILPMSWAMRRTGVLVERTAVTW